MEHTRDGELSLTLQERSVGNDELLRLAARRPISMIPSSEVFRPPRACSSISFVTIARRIAAADAAVSVKPRRAAAAPPFAIVAASEDCVAKSSKRLVCV